MGEFTNHLIELSDTLDKQGKITCANAVDNLIKESSLDKIAQYVGVIGYVLKQNRAMSNCIRKKRVASNTSMQEVVMDCLKEYQDGQDYNNTEWASKYASTIQTKPTKFAECHLSFLDQVKEDLDVENHIQNVKAASKILAENDVRDSVIETIESHFNTFGDILSKDESKANPFREAASPSPRGFWSRLWNPSSLSVNPLSWNKENRERGVQMDIDFNIDRLGEMMSEMEQVINRADDYNQIYSSMEVNKIIGEMRNDIQQLQSRKEFFENGVYLDALSRSLNILQKDPLNQEVFYDYVKNSFNTLTTSYQQGGLEETNIEDTMQRIRDYSPATPAPASSPEAVEPAETPSTAPPVDRNKVEDAAQDFVSVMGSDEAKRALVALRNVFNERQWREVLELILAAVETNTSEDAPVAPEASSPAKEDELPFHIPSRHPTAAFVINRTIKIADILDKIDPRLGDILDEYLEEHFNELSTLPEFPKFTSVVKEEMPS